MQTINNPSTPFFLVKEKIIAKNVNGFRDALDQHGNNSTLAYSIKTNTLPFLIQWMHSQHVMAEVVSDEEYELARICGYDPSEIVFNGPIKSEEYLKQAIQGGAIVNLDSKKDLEFLVNNNPPFKGNIGIRINPSPDIFQNEDIGYQEDGFRFGFAEENGCLGAAFDQFEKIYNNRKVGLHLHVNSITRSVAVYKAIAEYARFLVEKYNLSPPFIDIGGGFFGGVPGKPTPVEYLSVIREEFEKCERLSKVRLVVEPGSAMIGSAVELHTSVLDVKDTARARIVTTDGSRIHIDPLWIKSRYTYRIESKGKPHSKQIICGYTCMDHDRIMIIDNEPELSCGDRIVYEKVGNYTTTLGGSFICTAPAVYVENDDGIRLIRKKMSVSEYYQMETV